MNVAISQKKLSCMIFNKKNERKHNERKFWELTVCNGNCQDAAYLQGTKETIQPFWADFFALGSSNSEGAQIDTKDFKIKNSRPLLIFIFNLKRNVRGIFVLPKPCHWQCPLKNPFFNFILQSAIGWNIGNMWISHDIFDRGNCTFTVA